MKRATLAAMFLFLSFLPCSTAHAVTLYGTNSNTGVLYRIDNSGVGTPFVTGLNNPNALAVEPDGTVFVRTTETADRNSPFEILKVDSSGNSSIYLTGLTNSFNGFPSHERLRYTDVLGLDSSGNLFVANAAPGFPEAVFPDVPPGYLPIGVLKVDTGGNVTRVGTVWGGYDAIVVDRSDNLYANEASFGLYRIPASGPNTRVWSQSESSVADSNGNLFVSSVRDARVREIIPGIGSVVLCRNPRCAGLVC